jgi:hypothetical protein
MFSLIQHGYIRPCASGILLRNTLSIRQSTVQQYATIARGNCPHSHSGPFCPGAITGLKLQSYSGTAGPHFNCGSPAIAVNLAGYRWLGSLSLGAELMQVNSPSSPHLCSLPGIISPGLPFNTCVHTDFASSDNSILLSWHEK